MSDNTGPGAALPPVANAETVVRFLNKKKQNVQSLGIVKLAKALKWYYFYTSIILLGLWLWSRRPDIIDVMLTLNAIVVIALFALNYGLVFVSFLTSSWPRSKADPATQIHHLQADGDVVLGYIEKILTAIHIALFILFFPKVIPNLSAREHYIFYALVQIPRVITFFAGFPRQHFIQQLFIFIVRSVSLMSEFLVIVYVIYTCFANDAFQAVLICALLAGVPMALFYALFVRGLIFNKLFDTAQERYMGVGKVQRRWVIFFVFQLCAFMWGGSITLVHFLLPDYYYDGQPTLEIFLVLCSAVFLAIFTISSLYYSTLKVEVLAKVKSAYRLADKNPRLFLSLHSMPEYELVPEPQNNGKGKSPLPEGESFVPDLENGIAYEPYQEPYQEPYREGGAPVYENGVPYQGGVPEAESSDKSEDSPRARCIQHMSLVIACHKSQENIGPTLRAAIKAGFLPRNIFIAHNAGTPKPIDKTGAITWAPLHSTTIPIDPPSDSSSRPRNPSDFREVRYAHVPIGNKTIALYWVIANYVTTDMVMIIDDDVMIPENIDVEGAFYDLTTNVNMKAVAFTIRGIDQPNIWQSFQHLEYMMAGFVKIFQADFGSVMCCHGAIALWKTDTIKEVLLDHDTEFDGEDLQMGLILRRMAREYTIGVNAVEPVPTTAPRSLLYEPKKDEKSLLVQRIFSWDKAAHHFVIDFLEILVLNWERKSLILKPFLFIELWTQIQDWLRIIFLITMVRSSQDYAAVWALCLLLAIQLIIVFIFDRIILAHRPMLQISRYMLLLYPVYNAITLVFRFGGLLINVFYYTPWNPPRIKIRERINREEMPPKVEIDAIPYELREKYWDTIWVNPQDAYRLVRRR